MIKEQAIGENCELPLHSIVIDRSLQIRTNDTLNRVAVERYRTIVRNASKGGERLPPVTVVRISGQLYLIDGFHRFKAHELEARHTIDSVVLPCASHKDARWEAARCNLRHGLQLNAASRREAFKAFIRAKRYEDASPSASRQTKAQRPQPHIMTLQEIANEIGATKSTILNWLKADFKHVYSRWYERTGDQTASFSEDSENSYRPYLGETPAMIARQSLRNLTACIGQIRAGEELNETVAGIAEAISSLQKQFGPEAIATALEAGWQEGWFHRPAPADF